MNSAEEKKLRERIRKLEYENKMLRLQTTHWCPIVSSEELKQTIAERITDLGVSPFEVAIRADVSYNSFKKKYLDDNEAKSRLSLRPEDLKRICRLIGIKFRIIVIKGDINKINRNKLLNEKYIPSGERKKNKKLG